MIVSNVAIRPSNDPAQRLIVSSAEEHIAQKVDCFCKSSAIFKTLAVLSAVGLAAAAVLVSHYFALGYLVHVTCFMGERYWSTADGTTQKTHHTATPVVVRLREEVPQRNLFTLIRESPQDIQTKDLNTSKEYARKAFSFAIRTKNRVACERMLSQGADLLHRNDEGLTPLQEAALRFPAFAKKIFESPRYLFTKEDFDFALHTEDPELIRLCLSEPTYQFSSRQIQLGNDILLKRHSASELLRYYIMNHKKVKNAALLFESTISKNFEKIEKEDVFDLFATVRLKDLPDFLKVLSKIYPTLGVEAEVYMHTVWLSHTLEVGGKFSIGKDRYESEGTYNEIVSLKLLQIASSWNETDLAQKQGLMIPASHMEALETLSDPSVTPEELLQKIQENKPAVLASGWPGHRTYIVFYKGLFFKCNRGDGASTPGISVYKFDPSKLTPKLLIDISNGDDRALYKTGINRQLNARKVTSVCVDTQLVGNCEWASAELVIMAMDFAENYRGHKTKDAAKEHSQGVYQLFQQYAKGKAFENYERLSSPELSPYKDKAFISRLASRIAFVYNLPTNT